MWRLTVRLVAKKEDDGDERSTSKWPEMVVALSEEEGNDGGGLSSWWSWSVESERRWVGPD